MITELTAAITEKLTLGHPITYTATYRRWSKGDLRWWQTQEHDERQGIVIGIRTLWDGDVYTEHLDAEDGGGVSSTFTGREHKQAYLVAYALNRKPILVPIAHAVAR
jgi:hypothetical protein